MKPNNRYLRCAVVLGAAMLVTAGASATGSKKHHHSEQPPTIPRHTTGSLDICDFGAFFVGGVPKLTLYANSVTPSSGYQELIIGHMYVQYMIPNKRRGWPIIMVHGGGYAGSGLESTPDGREGWFAYSVRNRNATYVVDQAGRGRSGFDRSFINEKIATGDLADFPNLANTSSSGIWTGWFGHLINGSDITTGLLIKHGDPGDPQCDADPDHCTFNPAHPFDAIDPDIEARIGAIGPAPNPANNSQLALEHYKYGVPNTNVTLPSSDCPECSNGTANDNNTWSGQDLAKLVARLGGAVVVTHSQSGAVGHHMVRYLKAAGNLDLLKGLVTIDGSCDLPTAGVVATDFADIPYMGLRGYYTSFSENTCPATVEQINAAGGHAEYIRLDDPKYKGKFKGVTHMMMLGTGHLDVFDVIQNWVAKNVSGQSKKVACAKPNSRDVKDDHDHGHGHGHHKGRGRH